MRGLRADLGRGESSHASQAHTLPTVLVPIARHRSFGRLEQLDDRARVLRRQAFRHHRVDRKPYVAGTCAYAPRKGERLVETIPSGANTWRRRSIRVPHSFAAPMAELTPPMASDAISSTRARNSASPRPVNG